MYVMIRDMTHVCDDKRHDSCITLHETRLYTSEYSSNHTRLYILVNISVNIPHEAIAPQRISETLLLHSYYINTQTLLLHYYYITTQTLLTTFLLHYYINTQTLLLHSYYITHTKRSQHFRNCRRHYYYIPNTLLRKHYYYIPTTFLH